MERNILELVWAKDPLFETMFSPTEINIGHVTSIKIIGYESNKELLVSFINGEKLVLLYNQISLKALKTDKNSPIYTECEEVINSKQTHDERLISLDERIKKHEKEIQKLKEFKKLLIDIED